MRDVIQYLSIPRAIDCFINIASVCGTISGILTGRHVRKLKKDVGHIKGELDQISENILQRNIPIIQDKNKVNQNWVTDHSKIRNALYPIQREVGGEIITSAMIMSPAKLQNALVNKPSDLLLHIRPIHRPKKLRDPEIVPIVFENKGQLLIGWQKLAAIPFFLNCEYNPHLWKHATPVGSAIKPAAINAPIKITISCKCSKTVRFDLNTILQNPRCPICKRNVSISNNFKELLRLLLRDPHFSQFTESHRGSNLNLLMQSPLTKEEQRNGLLVACYINKARAEGKNHISSLTSMWDLEDNWDTS